MTKQGIGTDMLAAMMADAQACRRRRKDLDDGPRRGGCPKPETYGKTVDRRRDIAAMTAGRWVPLAQIAHRLGLSRPHTSTILCQMRQDGLVERRTVPTQSARGGARVAEWRAAQ